MPKITVKENEFIKNSNLRRETDSQPKQPIHGLDINFNPSNKNMLKQASLPKEQSTTFPSTSDTANTYTKNFTLKELPLEVSCQMNEQYIKDDLENYVSEENFNHQDMFKKDQNQRRFIMENMNTKDQGKKRSRNNYPTPFNDFYFKWVSKPKDNNLIAISEQDFGLSPPSNLGIKANKPVKIRETPTNKNSIDGNQGSYVISGTNMDFNSLNIKKSSVNYANKSKKMSGMNVIGYSSKPNQYRFSFKDSFNNDYNTTNNPCQLNRNISDTPCSDNFKSPEIRKTVMTGSSTENNPFYLSPKFSSCESEQVDTQETKAKNDEISSKIRKDNYLDEQNQMGNHTLRSSNGCKNLEPNNSFMNKTQDAQEKNIQKFSNQFNLSHMSKDSWARNPLYLRLKAKFVQKNYTARAYAAYDLKHNEYLWSDSVKSQRQVASLTKIMTYYTSMKIQEELSLNMNITRLKVSVSAYNKNGTTADLCDDDILTIKDLLYGMMQPSGNDAAQCLCENLGQLIKRRHEGNNPNENPAISKSTAKKKKKKVKLPENTYGFGSKASKSGEQYFLREMNKHARELGMMSSHWANPHGNYFFYYNFRFT